MSDLVKEHSVPAIATEHFSLEEADTEWIYTSTSRIISQDVRLLR
jgi:hypothetical protein